MDLANSYNAAGSVQRKLGDFAGAHASHRAELALKRRLVARDPPNHVYKVRLATALSYLAELEIALGSTDDATRDADASREMFAALAAADTSSPEKRRFLGTAHRIAATIALERGHGAAALGAVAASRALLDPQLARTPSNAVWQIALTRTLTLSSYALAAVGRARGADADARRAISIAAPILAARPADQNGRLALTDAYLAAGDAAQNAGDTASAHRAWEGAFATVDSAARATGVAELRALQAASLVRLGRMEDARPVVRALEQQGYRRPRWIARMRAAGLMTQQ
jgi:tetratricopeptide (TPR) repeat protein